MSTVSSVSCLGPAGMTWPSAGRGQECALLPKGAQPPLRGVRGCHPILHAPHVASSFRDYQHSRAKGCDYGNPPYFQHQPFGILNQRALCRADNQIYWWSSSLLETKQIPFNPFLKLFLTSAYNRVYLSA